MREPRYYKDFDRIPLDSVYTAMSENDLSECVVTAIDLLRKNNCFLKLKKIVKSTAESRMHLENGNRFLAESDYQNALYSYNKALMQAPPNSEIMKFAYYCRAVLLFKTTQFSSCVKDIDTCIAMGCSYEMTNKLTKMKTDALSRQPNNSSVPEHFFKIKVNINPNIPCVSSNVKVIRESQQPKVVAARDIPTGTVVALDQMFATSFGFDQFSVCYYCGTISFNLIPCDGCCFALFCDKECQKMSIEEGHNIESRIIEIFSDISISCILPFKAVLKMRQMCQSWDELIAASNKLGIDRMRNSTLADILVSDKFSPLNSFKTQHFMHGEMFNNCMYFANVIHYLDTTTSFLPESPEDKNAAIRAIARIMMHLSLNGTLISTFDAHCLGKENLVPYYYPKYIPNYSYFPFISKLSHSCLPNTYIHGTARDAKLVTTMLIKEGTELTVSYIPHYLVVEDIPRQELLFAMHKIQCFCVICKRDEHFKKQLLTNTQMEAFNKWSLELPMLIASKNMESLYKKSCQTLELMSNAPYPYSKEHVFVFSIFVSIFLRCKVIWK